MKAAVDIGKFRRLITEANYPANQNLIRLENLPSDSTENSIRNLFPGKKMAYFRQVNFVNKL